MPDINKLEATPRRALHVFYILDTSGSMAGTKIAQLNKAMEECTEALKDLAHNQADADLKIAVMQFDTDYKWITEQGPVSLEDFEYEYLETGNLTSIGCALKELDSKLSRKEYLASITGAFMPVIIFMTDGYPTDDYKKPLSDIRHNKWYQHATKIGFAIGEDGEVDIKMIAEIVGNVEAVIKTQDLTLFRKLMKFVSVRASMLASSSRTTNNVATGADIVKDAKKQLNLSDDEVTASLSDDQYNKEPEPPQSKDDDWGDDDWD